MSFTFYKLIGFIFELFYVYKEKIQKKYLFIFKTAISSTILVCFLPPFSPKHRDFNMNTALKRNGIQSSHIACYYQLLLSTTLPIYKHSQRRKGMKKKTCTIYSSEREKCARFLWNLPASKNTNHRLGNKSRFVNNMNSFHWLIPTPVDSLAPGRQWQLNRFWTTAAAHWGFLSCFPVTQRLSPKNILYNEDIMSSLNAW